MHPGVSEIISSAIARGNSVEDGQLAKRGARIRRQRSVFRKLRENYGTLRYFVRPKTR